MKEYPFHLWKRISISDSGRIKGASKFTAFSSRDCKHDYNIVLVQSESYDNTADL